ncbi:MAG: phosphotransferase [Desulfocapsa sp.]|nr:phosphotransferase [Desulfocapsa sp.]
MNDLLQKAGLTGAGEHSLKITPLMGDGSSRKFWRILLNGQGLCLAVAPPSISADGLKEARAARAIGLHLIQQGVRVPEQYGWDEESGILLFEDLGDCKLHDYVLQTQKKERDPVARIRASYKKVVESLVVMQVLGAEGFDPGWCWDTPRYDRSLMLERESGYFLRAFWQDFLGRQAPSGLKAEFVALAEQVALIAADYFLHRDFQSRNIMLHKDEPCFIDFQGGRLGPLGYDLASLLIDPYVSLSINLQDELLELYLDKLEELAAVDRGKFREEYLLLALQRNLQIVGAFAFLAKQKKKVFFRQFLLPALSSLNILLERDLFSEFRVLKKTALAALKELG